MHLLTASKKIEQIIPHKAKHLVSFIENAGKSGSVLLLLRNCSFGLALLL
jgi:hypothetical protein